MGRAGVVEHPALWDISGYHEIQQQRARYRIIDRPALAEALEVDLSNLSAAHAEWIDEALRARRQQREALWTDSVAVGGRRFVESVQRPTRRPWPLPRDRGARRGSPPAGSAGGLRPAFGGGNGANRRDSDMAHEA